MLQSLALPRGAASGRAFIRASRPTLTSRSGTECVIWNRSSSQKLRKAASPTTH